MIHKFISFWPRDTGLRDSHRKHKPKCRPSANSRRVHAPRPLNGRKRFSKTSRSNTSIGQQRVANGPNPLRSNRSSTHLIDRTRPSTYPSTLACGKPARGCSAAGLPEELIPQPSPILPAPWKVRLNGRRLCQAVRAREIHEEKSSPPAKDKRRPRALHSGRAKLRRD